MLKLVAAGKTNYCVRIFARTYISNCEEPLNMGANARSVELYVAVVGVTIPSNKPGHRSKAVFLTGVQQSPRIPYIRD